MSIKKESTLSREPSQSLIKSVPSQASREMSTKTQTQNKSTLSRKSLRLFRESQRRSRRVAAKPGTFRKSCRKPEKVGIEKGSAPACKGCPLRKSRSQPEKVETKPVKSAESQQKTTSSQEKSQPWQKRSVLSQES